MLKQYGHNLQVGERRDGDKSFLLTRKVSLVVQGGF